MKNVILAVLCVVVFGLAGLIGIGMILDRVQDDRSIDGQARGLSSSVGEGRSPTDVAAEMGTALDRVRQTQRHALIGGSIGTAVGLGAGLGFIAMKDRRSKKTKKTP